VGGEDEGGGEGLIGRKRSIRRCTCTLWCMVTYNIILQIIHRPYQSRHSFNHSQSIEGFCVYSQPWL
jgi:hypothetical protein